MHSRLVNVDFAYEQVVRSTRASMRELDDDYFRERAGDFLDVSRRVLRNLQGKAQAELHNLDTPSIVLAHDLSPSDTAGLDRKLVLGIVTEAGSRTSHSAIMARSLNLPAVVGVKGMIGKIEPGVEVLIDGYEGLFIVSPSEQTKADYQTREREHDVVEAKLDELRETLPITLDQRRIIVSAKCRDPRRSAARSRRTARRALGCSAPNIFSSTRMNSRPRTNRPRSIARWRTGVASRIT